MTSTKRIFRPANLAMIAASPVLMLAAQVLMPHDFAPAQSQSQPTPRPQVTRTITMAQAQAEVNTQVARLTRGKDCARKARPKVIPTTVLAHKAGALKVKTITFDQALKSKGMILDAFCY